MIFVSKMDREGKDAFDLFDELETELGINVRPLSWPINPGICIQRCLQHYKDNLNFYTPNKQTIKVNR